jgi:hypothetical protein
VDAPVSIRRDDKSGFVLSFTKRAAKGEELQSYSASSRQELANLIYELISASGAQETPNSIVFDKE